MSDETKTIPRIKGQVIYCGPMLPHLGLQYGAIFRDGILEHLYDAIGECSALGTMFVPINQYASVRRELDFDLGRNLRGTTGKYVACYNEVKNWRTTKAAPRISKPQSINQSRR